MKSEKGCASQTPSNPQIPEEVYDWLQRGGLKLIGKTGVRVIHDYMRHKQDQTEKFADLLEMEQRYCRQEPYISLGRYIHVMAQRPVPTFAGTYRND